jgi:predicted acyltransferase (DUF342 family)
MNWMDLSSTSNRYIQTYFNGFVDVSGGNVFIRGSSDGGPKGHLFINNGDISLNGRLFASGDVSFNSKLTVISDVSFGGNLYLKTGALYVGGSKFSISNIATDASVNGNLNVFGDVSFNKRLFVIGDVSFNSKLTVSSDVSFGGNLYLNTGALYVNGSKFSISNIASDASINGNLNVFGDVSFNKRLFVIGDVSFNSKLTVSSDVSFGGNLYLNTGALYVSGSKFSISNIASDASVNGNLNVLGDVSFNKRLFVIGDVSFNSRLNVISDVSLSGNTYVTNNFFLSGTSLLGPPPPVIFGTPKSTSTSIYIPWSYPTLVPVGFINNTYLPTITSIYVKFRGNYSPGGVYDTTVVNNAGTSSYIPITNTTDTNITGIILTKNTTGASGYQSSYPWINSDGTTSTRNVYIHANANISTLITDANNNYVTAYYNNYSSTVNSSSVNFSILLSSSPPSTPQSAPTWNTSNAQTQGTTSITVPLTFTSPLNVDSGDTGSSATIQVYDFLYSTIGSPICYSTNKAIQTNVDGTDITVSGATAAINTSVTVSLPNLYPDCSYTFKVRAKNSSNTGYSDYSAQSSAITTTYINPPALTAIPTSMTISSTTAYNSVYKVTDTYATTPITNLFLSKPTDGTPILTFDTVIHAIGTRGNTTSSALLAITANLTRGVSTIDTVPTVNFLGFGQAQPSGEKFNATPKAISITPGTVADGFTTTGAQGFYLKTTDNILKVYGNAFDASNSENKITLTLKQKNSAGTDIATPTVPSPYTYYYDTAPGTPVFSSLAFTLTNNGSNRSAAAERLSGIWVLRGNSVGITITSTVANMGSYFYKSEFLNYYQNGTRFGYETNLSKVTSTYTGNGFTGKSITCTNNSNGWDSTGTSYAKSISNLTANANNIATNTTSSPANSITAIVDNTNFSYISNDSIQIIGTSSAGAVVGYRVWSGSVLTTGSVLSNTILVPRFTHYNTTTSTNIGYINMQYQHSWNLVTTSNSTSYNFNYGYGTNSSSFSVTADGTQELMVANGAYQANNSDYNINYATYYYGTSQLNTLNYSNYKTLTTSNTAGYRFATFAWNISGLSSSYNYLNVVINGASYTEKVNGLLYSDATNKVLLFYRIEDGTTSNTYNLGYTTGSNPSTPASYWISFNDSNDTFATSGCSALVSNSNYYVIPGDNKPYYTVPSISSNTVKADLRYTTSNLFNCYIYVRIGISTNSTGYNFNSISAYLSN